MTVNARELVSGAICVAVGLFFVLSAWTSLDVGTARAMGPGYFPIMAGILLCFLGILIGLAGIRMPVQDFGPVPWRGIVMITAVPIVFGYLARQFGLLPTLAVCCAVAAFASRRMTLLYAAAMTPLLVLLCWFIFYYLLDLPIPLFGRWWLNVPLIGPWLVETWGS